MAGEIGAGRRDAVRFGPFSLSIDERQLTRCPLSEIALACGLADQAHLSRLFRRLESETPNAWRRRNFDGIGDGGTPRAPKAKRSTFAPASSGPVAAFRDA